MTRRPYSSSVSGGQTGCSGILLSVPPQTEGSREEAPLIDSVSTHPFAEGNRDMLGRADWKTKHDGARETYGAVEVYGVEVKWLAKALKTP